MTIESAELADGSTHKPQMPAPKQNLNAATNGLHLSRLRLTSLPPRWAHVTRTIAELRHALETAVQERHGEIDLYHAALIQSCCRWERHSQLAGKWLRENPDLPLSERMELSRTIATASDARDRCLKSLELDSKAGRNVWDCLRNPARQTPATIIPASTPVRPARDAADGQPATHEGK